MRGSLSYSGGKCCFVCCRLPGSCLKAWPEGASGARANQTFWMMSTSKLQLLRKLCLIPWSCSWRDELAAMISCPYWVDAAKEHFLQCSILAGKHWTAHWSYLFFAWLASFDFGCLALSFVYLADRTHWWCSLSICISPDRNQEIPVLFSSWYACSMISTGSTSHLEKDCCDIRSKLLTDCFNTNKKNERVL